MQKIDLWEWYNNIKKELIEIDFTNQEKEYIKAYYEDAGLLRSYRRPFFKKHYIDTFEKAATYLLAGQKLPLIIDLGGGTGTQVIYLALQGAKMVCIDMDTMALTIQKKRIKYYEQKYNTKLNITLIEKNTFEIDYSSFGKINGLYSMFAFNMMKPSDKLLDKILPNVSNDFRMVILDGNQQNYLTSLFKVRKIKGIWKPQEFANYLNNKGLEISKHHGGISILPIFWWFFPYSIGVKLDDFLNKNWLFPVSHQIYAKK